MENFVSRSLQAHRDPSKEADFGRWRDAVVENEGYYGEGAAAWAKMDDVEVESTPPAAVRLVKAAEKRSTISLSARLRSAPGPEDARSSRGAPQLVTAVDESPLTRLSHATVIHLAPESRLQITPVPGHREVWLEGRASCGVASDPNSAFLGRGSVGRAVAHESRFAVEAGSAETRVVVRVALEQGFGRRARPDAGGVVESESSRDSGELLDWLGATS